MTGIPLPLVIRPETPADASAVYAVEAQAFTRCAEADLVVALHEQGAVSLSLVAVLDNRIVGHILFTIVTVESEPAYYGIVALAPLAVHPDYQGRGIGTRLIQDGLEQCRVHGYVCVVVLGYPDYYPRFGFVPAHTYGLYCPFVERESPAFMALELRPGMLAGKHGLVQFHAAFASV